MFLIRRISSIWLGVSLLALALPLFGCVAKPSPEESAALTATAASHLVSTRTPTATVTAVPVSSPEPTGVSTATPVPSQSEISPESGLSTGIQAGQLAPEFALRNVEGEEVRLSDFRGQPVAMIFWASWCPYCKEEMPLLQSMYEKYGDQGLVVFGVDLVGSKGEIQENALAYVEQNGITFPILFDEGGQVFQQYRGRGIPNLIFIDREGVIASTFPGAMEAQNLETQIQQIVE